MTNKTLLIGLMLILSLSVSAQDEGKSKKIDFKKVGDKIENVFNGIFKKKPREEKTSQKKLLSPKVESTPAPQVVKAPIIDLESTDDLTVNMSPRRYRPRSEAVLKIGLLYYGDYYSDEDFAKIQDLLEKRFELATNSLLKLNVVFRAIMPFKQNIAQFPEYTLPNISDVERLQRLWYYDNQNMKVASEIYNEAKSHNLYGKDFANIDAMAIVTGAQFDGLGFAPGRLAITENPMEVAWGGETGGWVEYHSDEKVVDELIHELGHTLYIDHATKQCQVSGMTYQEKQACCDAAENKNDVLSYCRKRDEVDENHFFKFEECNQKNIKEFVIPAMLKGDVWAQKMNDCN